MSRISKTDLNTIRNSIKHIIGRREMNDLPGIICRGCPVSSYNNGLGISCRDFIDTIDKDVRTKAGCLDARGCEYRLETMKYILEHNSRGCKI